MKKGLVIYAASPINFLPPVPSEGKKSFGGAALVVKPQLLGREEGRWSI